MKYLWCTVTTETYVFFDFSIISPYPKQYVNFYQAYTQAAQSVHDHIAQSGDGPLDRGYWWMQPPNTNVDVFVQDSVGHMTYGILASTLDGLAEASLNYNKANYPMVFQVNDGKWGEVGIGGAGMVIGQGADQVCYYQMDSGGSKPCIDIENRKVIN